MFEFVTDRAEQGALSGPFRSMADQKKFRSIWGVVDGPLIGPWTGSMIENGEIYSADGKARIGGTPVLDAKGKPHIAKIGTSTFQEFQIPVDAVAKWNKYEARQGDEQMKAFQQREQSKAHLGRNPELEIDHRHITAEEVQDLTPAASGGAKKQASPAQIAALAKARAARKQKAAA